MYEGALGVPQDQVTALSWYIIASVTDDDSKTAAARLRKVMSVFDVAKAEKMAKAFKAEPAS